MFVSLYVHVHVLLKVEQAVVMDGIKNTLILSLTNHPSMELFSNVVGLFSTNYFGGDTAGSTTP